MATEEDIYIVGKMKMNDKNSPCFEIVLDTASGRYDGEIVLLKQISNEERDFYKKKIPFNIPPKK